MIQKTIYVLLSLIPVIFYGQVKLTMKPDKSDYNGKEIVNLTIALELNGDNLVQQSKIQLPDLSKFNMIGSGSYSQGLRDPETNTAIEEYITRIALEPKQKGKIRIGSVLVTVNNKIYKTEPFDIFIRDNDKKPVVLSNDLYMNMEIDDREVYQDQPTIAVLRVFSKNIDNLHKVKNVKLPDQDNIYVHPVNLKKSEIDPYGGGNIASQVLAVFMIFPNEAGNINVPPVSASVNSYSQKNTITSNKVKLNVKKLPEGSPESFKNAVGNFKVDMYYSTKEKVEIKKPIDVTIKISGEGNLGNIELPKIEKSKDYDVFTPKITSNIRPGKTALKGEILAKYILIPKKEGNLEVRTEPFAFFDPEQESYVDLGSESIKLVSFSHDQILAAQTPVEKVNEYTNTLLETVDSPVLKTTSFKVKEKNKFNWNVMFINLAILLGLVFIYKLFRIWQKKTRIVKDNKFEKSLGSVAETEQEIRQSLKTDISDYFNYLENLKDSKQYSKFFEIFEEMDSEVRSEYFSNSKQDFITFLQRHHGESVSQNYQDILHKVELERFSPIADGHTLNDLFSDIVKLYTLISK